MQPSASSFSFSFHDTEQFHSLSFILQGNCQKNNCVKNEKDFEN